MSPVGRLRSAAGSMSLELVLMTPVLLVLLLLVVAGGRLAQARGDVDGAARDAARAASLARDPVTAESVARAAARFRLREGGVTCRQLDLEVDTGSFVPDGFVTATVSCAVDLGDLTGLRLPASRVMTSTFAEPLDAFRGTR